MKVLEIRWIILCQCHWALWKGRNLYFKLHFPGMKLGKPVKGGLEQLWTRLRCKGQWGSWNTIVLSRMSLREILGWCLVSGKDFVMNEGGSFWQKTCLLLKALSNSVTVAQSWTLGSNAQALRVSATKGAQAWEGFTILKEARVYGMNWTNGTVASCTVVTLGGNKKQWQ